MHTGKDNIKSDLQGVELGGMDWTYPFQCGNRWQALGNFIVYLQVP
jgi:hypothetical protein